METIPVSTPPCDLWMSPASVHPLPGSVDRQGTPYRFNAFIACSW
jgi:hypothetical protein